MLPRPQAICVQMPREMQSAQNYGETLDSLALNVGTQHMAHTHVHGLQAPHTPKPRQTIPPQSRDMLQLSLTRRHDPTEYRHTHKHELTDGHTDGHTDGQRQRETNWNNQAHLFFMWRGEDGRGASREGGACEIHCWSPDTMCARSTFRCPCL